MIAPMVLALQAIATPTQASPTDKLIMLCYMRSGTFDGELRFTPNGKTADVLAIAFSLPKLINSPAAPSTIYDPTRFLEGAELVENDYESVTKKYAFFLGPKDTRITLMVSPPDQGKTLGSAILFRIGKGKPMPGRSGACLVSITDDVEKSLEKVKTMPETMQ